MIRHRKEIDEKGNREILYILREHGPCQPRDIMNYLKRIKREAVKEKYLYSGKMSGSKAEIAIKKAIMKRETVQRKLKKLIDSGHVIKEGNKYLLSKTAFTELRFFDNLMGKRFGYGLMLHTLVHYSPVNKNTAKKVEEIISIFGFFLLFSAIEACRPIELDGGEKLTLDKDIKEHISLQWFKNSLDPELILNAFICTLARNFDYKDRNYFIEKYSYLSDQTGRGSDQVNTLKKRFLSPLTGMDLYDMHYLDTQLNDEESRNKAESMSRFEISQDKVDEIKTILEKMYPDIYYLVDLTCNKTFENAKESYFGSSDLLRDLRK